MKITGNKMKKFKFGDKVTWNPYWNKRKKLRGIIIDNHPERPHITTIAIKDSTSPMENLWNCELKNLKRGWKK